MASSIRDGKGHRAYRRAQAALKRRTREDDLPCWLCGDQVDTTLPATDGMSFTADHVEALGNGGHLVRNELRPAHRSCNARRGNRADAENVRYVRPENGTPAYASPIADVVFGSAVTLAFTASGTSGVKVTATVTGSTAYCTLHITALSGGGGSDTNQRGVTVGLLL